MVLAPQDRVYEAGLDELLTVDVPRLAAQLGGPQAVVSGGGGQDGAFASGSP